MSRKRLLKTRPDGFGLYSYDGSDGYGPRLVWEALPPVRIDPETRLRAEAASAGPKLGDIGGLYGDAEEQRRRAARLRANRVLEQYGIRPRSTW